MKVTSLEMFAYTWLLVKVKLAVVTYIVVFYRISLIQFDVVCVTSKSGTEKSQENY